MKFFTCNLTDEEHQSIGIHAEDLVMKEPYFYALKASGVSGDQILTPDDQNLILFWAGCLGVDRITQELFGQEDPKGDETAKEFLQRLYSVLRANGKQAIRQRLLDETQGATVVSFTNRSGFRLVIHPAVRADRESDWQLTTMGFDGRPCGHNNPPSFQEALFRAGGVSDECYWNESGYTYEWSDNKGGRPPI